MKDNAGKVEITLNNSIFETMPTNDTLTINNYTKDTVRTGTDFTIEYRSKDGWQLFPFNEGIGFNSVEISILPEHSYSLDVFFYPGTHHYSSGKYRIVKHYSINNTELSSYFEFSLK